MNTSQTLRSGATGLDQALQRSLTEQVAPQYRELAQLLIEEGRIAEAEQVLDMLKEYEHFEFVRRDATNDPRQTQAALTEEERELTTQLNENGQRLSILFGQIETLRKVTQRSAEQEASYQRLREELNAASQQFATLFTKVEQQLRQDKSGSGPAVAKEAIDTRATVRDALAWLQEQSGVRAGVLYILPRENDTAFILTTQNGSLSVKGGLGEKALNQLTGELRRAIAERKAEYVDIAAKLYEALINPVRSQLVEAKIDALMLYLIDGLRYIPMAALYDATEKKYLVRTVRTIDLHSCGPGETQRISEVPMASCCFWDEQSQSSLRCFACGRAGAKARGARIRRNRRRHSARKPISG